MDHIDAPALLAYRAGDVFATIVEILKQIPKGRSCSADSLEDLLKLYVFSSIVCFSFHRLLTLCIDTGFCRPPFLKVFSSPILFMLCNIIAPLQRAQRAHWASCRFHFLYRILFWPLLPFDSLTRALLSLLGGYSLIHFLALHVSSIVLFHLSPASSAWNSEISKSFRSSVSFVFWTYGVHLSIDWFHWRYYHLDWLELGFSLDHISCCFINHLDHCSRQLLTWKSPLYEGHPNPTNLIEVEIQIRISGPEK